MLASKLWSWRPAQTIMLTAFVLGFHTSGEVPEEVVHESGLDIVGAGVSGASVELC